MTAAGGGAPPQYQALFELAPDGYLVTNAAGVIHTANQAAARLLGMPQGQTWEVPFRPPAR
jgi:PAS domain-containing protein